VRRSGRLMARRSSGKFLLLRNIIRPMKTAAKEQVKDRAVERQIDNLRENHPASRTSYYVLDALLSFLMQSLIA